MANLEQVGFNAQLAGGVPFLSIELNQKKKVAFIESVPGMESPITKIKRHYIAEKENGKYIRCTGGLCCSVYTWNSFEKAYTKSKAQTAYWVPVIVYDNDKDTLEPICYIGLLTLNYFQYTKLCEQVVSCDAGTLPFFQRDCMISFAKNGQYNDYAFIKGETKAIWMSNQKMKAIVDEQLETLAERINSILPPEYSETEMAELIEKWNAVKQAKQAAEDIAVAEALATATKNQNASQVAYNAVNTIAQPSTQTVTAECNVTTLPTADTSVVEAVQQVATEATTNVVEAIQQVTAEPQEQFTLDALAGVLGNNTNNQ